MHIKYLERYLAHNKHLLNIDHSYIAIECLCVCVLSVYVCSGCIMKTPA